MEKCISGREGKWLLRRAYSINLEPRELRKECDGAISNEFIGQPEFSVISLCKQMM